MSGPARRWVRVLPQAAPTYSRLFAFIEEKVARPGSQTRAADSLIVRRQLHTLHTIQGPFKSPDMKLHHFGDNFPAKLVVFSEFRLCHPSSCSIQTPPQDAGAGAGCELRRPVVPFTPTGQVTAARHGQGEEGGAGGRGGQEDRDQERRHKMYL